MGVVIDTNVAMVASGHSPQADTACADACVQRLSKIMESGGLLVDDLGLILDEYVRALGYKGRPDAGEKFVKWAFSNQSNPEAVRKIAVTKRADNGWRRFDEFPDHADFKTFDKSDQKFVAVALASKKNPPILNATDSDWCKHREALKQAGVRVEQLCQRVTPSPAPRTGRAFLHDPRSPSSLSRSSPRRARPS